MTNEEERKKIEDSLENIMTAGIIMLKSTYKIDDNIKIAFYIRNAAEYALLVDRLKHPTKE